jgi:hypothetical protein
MTWTKLGDEFADECWTLSDKAFRLHTEGLLWSNRMLTDGQLAREDMRRWAHHPETAEELVSIGWWEDCGAHYQIVHHLGYQRTREQVAKQSLANRANRAKGKARPVRPKNDSSDHSSTSQKSSDDSSDERDRTGQARIGKKAGWPKMETSRSFRPLNSCAASTQPSARATNHETWVRPGRLPLPAPTNVLVLSSVAVNTARAQPQIKPSQKE